MVRLFNTTETDDKAIAAAHTAGLNIIPNAGYSIPAATVIKGTASNTSSFIPCFLKMCLSLKK